MLSQVIEGGKIVDSYFTADPLTLDTKNADALILGSSTREGGDIRVYRDALGNLQMSLDADAPSNVKALDVYGGVVCQHYLTAGQANLNTSAPIYANGNIKANGNLIAGGNVYGVDLVIENSIYNRLINTSELSFNILITGTDSTNHAVNLQIDNNNIITVQATGDGAGGITNKSIGLYETTPTTQAAVIADATDAASAITQLNLLLAANRKIGLIAT